MDKTAKFREDDTKLRSKILSHLSASVLALLFIALVLQFDLHNLNGLIVDAFFRLDSTRHPHPSIALIAYDDDSSVRFEGLTHVPVTELSNIVQAVSADKPLAVAFLGPVNEKTYTDTELSLLAKSFSLIPKMYIGYTDDESLGKNAPPALLHTAKYLPGYLSRDTFSYGADSVTRRVMVSIEGIPTIYSKLSDVFHQEQIDSSKKFDHIERLQGSSQTYIHWQGPSGTYLPISSLDVVRGNFKSGTFKNKIVLIGSSLTARKGADHIFTPYSRNHFSTTALEGAAHSLATLLDNKGIARTSGFINFIVAVLIGLITVNLVLYLSPGKGILVIVAELAVLFSLGAILLLKSSVWLGLAHPILIAFFSYYLVIPYRLVDEYRKRWHYQEKSELMFQLEQLKSNFLSLISHDLKTPIARIQGNAELLLSDKSPVSETQKKSLDAIVHTTEDLGHYVQTVLDLTRIESSEVPLQKVSKDINGIIREVIDSKKPIALERGIELRAELEPLFSIKFDPKLMRQVISNLVENAIKYSPNNTSITLRSREEGKWVKVEVADQGFGISSEEQEKVFSKFYRCKDPNSAEIKGTGLGLYLVKYFVELHEGFVELHSEVGKGSNFTIALPV